MHLPAGDGDRTAAACDRGAPCAPSCLVQALWATAALGASAALEGLLVEGPQGALPAALLPAAVTPTAPHPGRGAAASKSGAAAAAAGGRGGEAGGGTASGAGRQASGGSAPRGLTRQTTGGPGVAGATGAFHVQNAREGAPLSRRAPGRDCLACAAGSSAAAAGGAAAQLLWLDAWMVAALQQSGQFGAPDLASSLWAFAELGAPTHLFGRPFSPHQSCSSFSCSCSSAVLVFASSNRERQRWLMSCRCVRRRRQAAAGAAGGVAAPRRGGAWRHDVQGAGLGGGRAGRAEVPPHRRMARGLCG